MRKAVGLSFAAVGILSTVLAIGPLASGDQARAACGDGIGLALACVKPTTTTIPETTTTIPPSTTSLPKETTTTTTTMPEETTTTIPTEVLPTVVTTSTTTEVGDIEVLPLTGDSSGTLVALATGLLTVGALGVLSARRSRSAS